MPNPFKRRGSSYRSDDWRAWGIGLLGQLEAEFAGELPLTMVLLGDIERRLDARLAQAYQARWSRGSAPTRRSHP